MKEPRIVLGLIRKEVGEGVFPGTSEGQPSRWKQDPFHILISTVLSQRTRDQNTYVASDRLFSRFDSPQAIARASLKDLVELIRPAGFPEQKARAIKEISRRICEDLGGEVPRELERLVELPMVGRKTANCVISYAFRIPAICVDTHVHRISNRIGWVKTKDPEETELELQKMVPKDLWIEVNSLLVRFGQLICLPRNPRCSICPIRRHCDYYTDVFLPKTGSEAATSKCHRRRR